MGFWNECIASIPLLACASAPSAALWLCQDSIAMEQPCAKAPAWMCHWEGTPEPHNLTATSCRGNSGCKRASSPFLQLVWLVGHKPGKIPVHNKPSKDGKNGGCRDPELPQPSWEFPFKRWHHQKLMHGGSTHTYEWEVQRISGGTLFFPSHKYIEGKTPSSHKAKETQFLQIEVYFRRDTNPWGCANKE